MDKKRLLSYGYFFKELPPPFTSISLGEKVDLIKGLSSESTKSIDFSIPKGQYSRRYLQLPNPTSFVQLVIHICDPDNWSILESHFSSTTYSHSKVFENTDAGTKILNKDNRAIKTNYGTFSESKERTIVSSYDMLYELKIDIAKYYPSIYTHSIAWVILGKKRAKELWKLKSKKSEPDFALYDFADKLDTCITNCQDYQSIGIPIGPDTSHIISEIIGTYLDKKLQLKYPTAKAVRYFDDYSIYLETEEQAQGALKFIQKLLADLQLSLNEDKLSIRRFPFGFQDAWAKEINNISLKNLNSSNLRYYFSNVFALAKKYPDISGVIFNYALKTFETRTIEVGINTWQVFEALLLKSMLVEPSILETASRIIETYRLFFSRSNTKVVLVKILHYHSELNHHYETTWTLWIFKQLRLRLPNDLIEKIINTEDNFSILILLDLNNEKLITGGLTDVQLQSIVDLINLDQTTNWLLYYEAVEIKKWIKAKKRTGFTQLSKAKISFYNPKNVIKVFPKTVKTE